MNVPKIITLEEMRSETGIGASEVGSRLPPFAVGNRARIVGGQDWP